MEITLIIVLGVLGALLGSFACAQVWRLRAQQLVEDKRDGEAVDVKEYQNLKQLLRPALHDRSECLRCHHRLVWYDLVPIISWISLSGRCRYCRQLIGWTELFAELALAVVFVGSYLLWPLPLTTALSVASFGLWLVACTLMTILFIYDMKWALLPFMVNLMFIGVAALYSLTTFTEVGGNVGSLVGALALLSGLYLVFSLFGWVGMGDGILGAGLALLVGKWELAFLVLFIANLLGCLMLIPLFLRKKLHRQMRIPFGPFLILATMVVFFWGTPIINWAMASSGDVLNSLML